MSTSKAILPCFVVETLALIARALKFYPDAIAYGRAYALGLQSPGFSEETKTQCHEALVKELTARKRYSGRRKWKTIAPDCEGSWHDSAAGVVGTYTVEAIRLSPEGVHVTCKDTWDFNVSDQDIHIPMPKWLGMCLVHVLNFLFSENLFHFVEYSYKETEEEEGEIIEVEHYAAWFSVVESRLSRFNENSFSTIWEDFISWEEIKSSQEKWVTNGFTMWTRSEVVINDDYIEFEEIIEDDQTEDHPEDHPDCDDFDDPEEEELWNNKFLSMLD